MTKQFVAACMEGRFYSCFSCQGNDAHISPASSSSSWCEKDIERDERERERASNLEKKRGRESRESKPSFVEKVFDKTEKKTF